MLPVTLNGIKMLPEAVVSMTKPLNIEYKSGMKFSCGPPMRAGGYTTWNWCKLCDTIYEKKINRCNDCNQQLRSSAKCNKNWEKVN